MVKTRQLGIVALFGAVLVCASCGPYYTWGYAPTLHPEAAEAYIYAVMARENGDYALAIQYYDRALRRTRSDKVLREREEAERLFDEELGKGQGDRG